MRLEINGKNIELSVEDKIRYTLQANTLNDLTTRQSNFTPSFKLPKTPNNVEAFESLSLVGNNSTIPYRKNDAFLFDNSGEAIISYGWAVIKETKDEYKCYIYDGVIDFYKAIENKTLTDTGLQELNHLKNLDTVAETWTDTTLPYRYNIADYNGNAIYDLNKINIDYLIPSANVKYLWDKIFEHIGWTYSGSVFDMESFKNLWMTYPKTISSETQVTTPAASLSWSEAIRIGTLINFIYHNSLIACISCSLVDNEYLLGSQNTIQVNGSTTTMKNDEITVLQTGIYKFIISGIIYNSNFDTSTNISFSQGTGADYILDPMGQVDFGEDFNIVYYRNLVAGDSFRIQLDTFVIDGAYGDIDINIEFVEGNTVDFEEALVEFSITDFIREILVRFALTPFSDRLNKNVEFLTLDEIIQTNEVDDWSEKYQSKLSESYVYGNYGRISRFSYKYNDNEESHNDGFILIDNINLKDQVTIFSSKIYSPEKKKSNLLTFLLNVYKFYEKEVKDDGSLEYKPLENRFYFMKSKVFENTIQIGSDEFLDTRSPTAFALEDFTALDWNSILNQNYPAINAVINRSKLFKLLMNFSSLDIKKMDFRKLVYIKQQSAYFLKHKISSWKPGNPNTSTQLLRLDLSVSNNSVVEMNPQIIINSEITDPLPPIQNSPLIHTDYAFIDFSPQSATIYMKQLDASPSDGGAPTGFEYTGSVDLNGNAFNQVLPILEPFYFGWYEVQIISANGIESNIEHVYWGNSGTSNQDPSIDVMPELLGEVFYGVPHQRDISYRFNNFTPLSATLSIQQYNFITGELGDITSSALTNLTSDTLHTLQDFNVPVGFGFFTVRLETDTITYQQNLFFQ